MRIKNAGGGGDQSHRRVTKAMQPGRLQCYLLLDRISPGFAVAVTLFSALRHFCATHFLFRQLRLKLEDFMSFRGFDPVGECNT